MIYKTQELEVDTNLGGSSFEKLLTGEWKLAFINRNPEIINENNSDYYHDEEIENSSRRCLNNKVNVTLIDGLQENAHIIHWVPSNGYFVVTFSKFWDRFDNSGKLKN